MSAPSLYVMIEFLLIFCFVCRKSVDKKTKKALEELFGINARTAETSTTAVLEEEALEVLLFNMIVLLVLDNLQTFAKYRISQR
jgi:uncharacterized PurR-regulated membrane protein YhhQ (DUF165 family)